VLEGLFFWNGWVGCCGKTTLLLDDILLFVNCVVGANAFVGVMIDVDSNTTVLVTMKIGIDLIVPTCRIGSFLRN